MVQPLDDVALQIFQLFLPVLQICLDTDVLCRWVALRPSLMIHFRKSAPIEFQEQSSKPHVVYKGYRQSSRTLVDCESPTDASPLFQLKGLRYNSAFLFYQSSMLSPTIFIKKNSRRSATLNARFIFTVKCYEIFQMYFLVRLHHSDFFPLSYLINIFLAREINFFKNE